MLSFFRVEHSRQAHVQDVTISRVMQQFSVNTLHAANTSKGTECMLLSELSYVKTVNVKN